VAIEGAPRPYLVLKEGILLHVKAQPGARANRVQGLKGEALAVQVTAPPDKGKANQAIIELLAEWLDCPKSRLLLKSGESSRNKKILIPEPFRDKLDQRLEELTKRPS